MFFTPYFPLDTLFNILMYVLYIIPKVLYEMTRPTSVEVYVVGSKNDCLLCQGRVIGTCPCVLLNNANTCHTKLTAGKAKLYLHHAASRLLVPYFISHLS